MRNSLALAGFVSLGLLAGCGSRQPERAEGGAAAGAPLGRYRRACRRTGGRGGRRPVIGGAGGATAGAATKPQDVNLGAPPWQDNSKAGQKAATHMTQ
jgi:hypothetical protein